MKPSKVRRYHYVSGPIDGAHEDVAEDDTEIEMLGQVSVPLEPDQRTPLRAGHHADFLEPRWNAVYEAFGDLLVFSHIEAE